MPFHRRDACEKLESSRLAQALRGLRDCQAAGQQHLLGAGRLRRAGEEQITNLAGQ